MMSERAVLLNYETTFVAHSLTSYSLLANLKHNIAKTKVKAVATSVSKLVLDVKLPIVFKANTIINIQRNVLMVFRGIFILFIFPLINTIKSIRQFITIEMLSNKYISSMLLSFPAQTIKLQNQTIIGVVLLNYEDESRLILFGVKMI